MERSITQPLAEQTSAVDRAKRQYKYDAISTGTGVFLALFMWGHMAFVASVLVGAVGFDTIAEPMEKYFVAQLGYVMVIISFFVHFVTASRKIPGKLQERKLIKELGDGIQTSEWNISSEQKRVLDKVRIQVVDDAELVDDPAHQLAARVR